MKKTIYVISWIILGILLSFIAHALIEVKILANNSSPVWILNGACALPLWLFIILPVLGIALGVWAGFFFWQKVYVETLKKY